MRQVPASAGQRLLWFLDRHHGQGGTLNCPMVCRLTGPLDLARLTVAVGKLAARHESLRTTFTGAGRGLTQVVHDPGPLPLSRVSLDGPGAVGEALTVELGTRVDPVIWPVRVHLWQASSTEHVLCVNMHHLITDTWSCDVLLREVALCYSAAAEDGQVLPPPAWQYRHFALWQARQFRRPDFLRHQEYWRAQLTGAGPLDLPIGQARAVGARRRAEQSQIPDEVGAKLRELARVSGTTIFAVMLAVYYAMLCRATSQPDLSVSSLFANRAKPEVQNTVGFIANMLVLRARLPADATFADTVAVARRVVIGATAHQELPFHLLTQVTTRPGKLRLDDVVFQMLSQPLEASITAGDLEFTGMVPDVSGRFDFELALMPRGSGFAVKLFFSQDRVDPRWARAFLAKYVALAAAAASDPAAQVASLPA